MNFDQYALTASSSLTEYHFISSGAKGDFPKIVQYTYLEDEGVVNLAFGLLREDGSIDDTFRTGNGDSDKILATVGNTVLMFTERYPDLPVFATGSTPSRTRLYRRMLSLNKKDVEELFHVFGRKDNSWFTFELGSDYDAFLVVRRKMGKFDRESTAEKK